jgi:rhodanese-related sulfurtransferase
MNTRERFSVILLILGLILVIIPGSGNRILVFKAEKLLPETLEENSFLSVDQVARLIVTEDRNIRLIDLRREEEFRKFNIPGSVNIPYLEFLKNNNDRYLSDNGIRKILYSNGDLESNYCYIIARGSDYKNILVMKGGMNEWFRTVMNSTFTGERITARENALFETRSRAGKLFTEMNSLPDSLKAKFIKAKLAAVKKLDGGCE